MGRVRVMDTSPRVRLRYKETRLEPNPLPFLDYSFGNLFRVTTAIVSKETSWEEWSSIVGKLRDAKRKIDKDYVKKLQQGIVST